MTKINPIKNKVVNKVKKAAVKKPNKQPQTPPDTFTKQASNNDNLQFKTKKIKFSRADIERMKNMTVEEQIAYKRKLKSEGKYTYEN